MWSAGSLSIIATLLLPGPTTISCLIASHEGWFDILVAENRDREHVCLTWCPRNVISESRCPFPFLYINSTKVSEVTQSCPTLCDPMDCSPPGFSVHVILQARILEWVAISFSRGSSQPRDRTWVSCTAGRFFTTEPPGKRNSTM